MIAQFLLQVRALTSTPPFTVTNATTPWPFNSSGRADHRCFRDLRVTDQRALDFRGAESMTGDVQHVVDAADDPEITVLVAARAVAGEIIAFEFAPILFSGNAPCRRRSCATSTAMVGE